MTAPHPALLQLVRGDEVGPISDEDAFLESLSEHRMTAAVLSGQEQGNLRLSEPAGMTLGMWDLAERRRHIVFWDTIGEIHTRLGSLGARCAVLKGVATEARWYGEVGQRVCTDVDLLLAPWALDGVAEIIQVLDPDRDAPTTVEWLVRRRLLQHIDLRVGGTAVDLHFDPLKIGLPTRQLDEVWSTTEELATPQGTALVLCPEIELVLLLLHLNKDRFAFLGPFLDIRHIIERAALEWDYLQAFVAEEGLEVPVWKSLAAVTEVLRLDIDPPPVGGPRTRTWERLWGEDVRLRGHEGRRSAPSIQPFLALHARGRGGENLRELRRQVLPPRQLLEVAGRLDHDASYLRYLAIDRFRTRAAASPP